MIIHILDEEVSPPENFIWRMWCGASCMACDDGELIPLLDFVLEKEKHDATCNNCIKLDKPKRLIKELELV
jgi:hypothetical protein